MLECFWLISPLPEQVTSLVPYQEWTFLAQNGLRIHRFSISEHRRFDQNLEALVLYIKFPKKGFISLNNLNYLDSQTKSRSPLVNDVQDPALDKMSLLYSNQVVGIEKLTIFSFFGCLFNTQGHRAGVGSTAWAKGKKKQKKSERFRQPG